MGMHVATEAKREFSRRSCAQHRNQYQANRIDQRMYHHYYEQVRAEEKYKRQNKSEDARNQKSRSPSKEPGVRYREGSKRQQSRQPPISCETSKNGDPESAKYKFYWTSLYTRAPGDDFRTSAFGRLCFGHQPDKEYQATNGDAGQCDETSGVTEHLHEKTRTEVTCCRTQASGQGHKTLRKIEASRILH
jgi:hypothetical protein